MPWDETYGLLPGRGVLDGRRPAPGVAGPGRGPGRGPGVGAPGRGAADRAAAPGRSSGRRGSAGRACADRGAAGFGSGFASAARGSAGRGPGRAAGRGAGLALVVSATRLAPGSGAPEAARGADGAGAPTVGWGAGGFAGAAGLSVGRAGPGLAAAALAAFSRSLRTTGGSIVDEAERTNSPMSLSLVRSSLLSSPSSFASSQTRTLATTLLQVRTRASRTTSWFSLRRTHRVVMSASPPSGRHLPELGS